MHALHQKKKGISKFVIGCTVALENSGTIFSEFRSPKSLNCCFKSFNMPKLCKAAVQCPPNLTSKKLGTAILHNLQCAKTFQSGCTRRRSPVARSVLSSVGSPRSSLHSLRGDESRESSEARSRSRSSRASRSSGRETWKDREARSRLVGSRDQSHWSRSRSASRSRSSEWWTDLVSISFHP